ncbi:MAG: prolyl oligopeptidase family serine peptidase [Saprospiraceae bacterium]|nr:prolyl oligopeptidase family serine peptidase [Saprospiraceae bacterium]
MHGPDFIGHLPSEPFWSEDNSTIYFKWNRDSLPDEEQYRYRIDGSPERLEINEVKNLPSATGQYSSDFTKKVYQKGGDLFIEDIYAGNRLQITKTLDYESSPAFSADDQAIIFKRDNNGFSWSIQDGSLRQLTQFIKGKEDEEKDLSGQKGWLEKDQLEHFLILKERKEKKEWNEELHDKLRPQYPRKIFLDDHDLAGFEVSPDLKYVVYRLQKDAKDKATIVPDYVTQSGYATDLRARAKVGDAQPVYSSYVYDIQADTVIKIETEQIPGIYEKPKYFSEYHRGDETYVDTFELPRPVIINGPVFNQDGSRAVVVIRSQDNKDRWIMSVDLTRGKLQLIDRQRDEAWIGGPGIEGWNSSLGNIGFLQGGNSLWFQSEKTGYSHIYIYDFLTGKTTALTSGEFEILDAKLSRDQKFFYVQASKENSFENHFYKISATSGIWSKITTGPGNHQVAISPDESRLAVLYSYSNQPTELFWMDNQEGAELRKITNSTTAEFNNYNWRDPEIIHFKARDDVMVPARIYKPEAGRKNGAAVIFVHGAGYLHNVHRWWSSYYRECMFHNFLADQGYTVLDIDYRGSAGYGRDWRTAIYRFMGGKDLDDQVDGVRYLIENQGIEKERIGIYGGSYGGFITLMALCTSPGTFSCGAALRSVTDWAHYNHGYTSNILNTPVEDSIAYRRSSPIYHAEGLQGNLVMLHGMVDRNVHFQDVVRMSQRFIELGKDDWELAVFPMEDHGFIESSSWVDEYKRIYRLFEKNLRE